MIMFLIGFLQNDLLPPLPIINIKMNETIDILTNMENEDE